MSNMDVSQNEKVEKFEILEEPKISDARHKTERPFWKSHPEMLKFKSLYFFQCGGGGAIVPYTPFIAKDGIGLSATGFATAILLQRFLTFLIKPALGYVADYFNRIKTMIIVMTVIQAAFFAFMVAVPKIQKDGTLDGKKQRFVFQSFKSCHVCHSDAILAVPALTLESYVISNTKANQSLNEFCHTIDKLRLNISNEADFERRWNVSDLSSNFDSVKHVDVHSMNVSDEVVVSCRRVPYSYCLYCTDHCGLCCSNSSECLLEDHRRQGAGSISDFQTYQFYAFAFLFIVALAANDCVHTLIDTACLENTQKCGADIGRQMMWGSIGFGLVALPVGFFIDYTGSYLVAYYFVAALCVITLWNIVVIDFVKPHKSANILADFKSTLKSEEFTVFLIGALLNGIAYGHVTFHLFWFVRSIGGNGIVVGLIQVIGMVFGRVPFLIVSGWIIRKIGHFHVTSLSLLVYSLRMTWYSYLHNPYLVLPIEWTNGINSGLYLAAAASYAKLCSKPGTEALMQSIVSSTFICLGVGIGSLLTGVGFDYYGGHQTYFVSGVIFGGFAILNYLYTVIRNFRQTKRITSDSKPVTA